MMSYNGREEGTRKKRKRIENEVVVSSTNNNNNNSIKPIFNERLNNLRILQTIIVLYSFLYDLFYIGGFFLILLSYYNHGEMIIYSVVFILNLINIIAIILFYYGLSKQNLYLIQIYQIINSIAIALELFMLAYAFIFSSDLEIRNLLSSVFLFIYECIFVASNIFVQWYTSNLK
ncbi:hypothetical protein BLOT_007520 [Blomia tropicalis]|nr:hypothetical protein BLOT_007520 [Blomia tropicalis]